MAQKFTNAARSPLMANIAAGDTSLTVDAALADLFPVADTGASAVPTVGKDFFKVVLQDTSGNIEIVYVRTRTLGSATFSNVMRGQEGTTARAYLAGSIVGLRYTALDLAGAIDLAVNATTAGKAIINATTSTAQRTAMGAAASGANSDITSLTAITSINSGPIAGMRNKLRNGDFSVNQMAVSGTVVLGAGNYGHDMWKAGAAGCTYTFSMVQNVTTITITAGSLIQVIEGKYLQSGTYCLGWGGTAQGKIGTGAYGASGITGVAVGGTNLNVEFGTGTLMFVQFESGTQPSYFEFRLNELQLCQPYYQLITGLSVYSYMNSGAAAICTVSFKVTMRAAPVVTITNNGSLINSTACTTYAPTTDGFGFGAIATATGVTGAIGAQATASSRL